MVKNAQSAVQKGVKPGVSDAERMFDAGLKGRLAEVINAYESRGAAALAGGVSVNQIGRYLRGDQEPAFETIARIAAGKGFSLDWVWAGRGSKMVGGAVTDDDESNAPQVSIPVLNVRAGAGEEQWADDEAPISQLKLPASYLRQLGIKPSTARIVFCHGRGMEPTIRDGAPMIIDTSDRGEADEVYVLRRGMAVIIRRLQHLVDGGVLLKSDSASIEPEKLPRDDADELQVVGRVRLVLQSL